MNRLVSILVTFMGLTFFISASASVPGAPMTKSALQDNFCKLSITSQSHPIFPVALLQSLQNSTIKCDAVEYKFQIQPDTNDKGHNMFNIIPIKGNKLALDCDAKADVGMKNVAFNCMPVSQETIQHR
jgi:hypothetical protein